MAVILILMIESEPQEGIIMELKKDTRCYTDVCIDGKWFHYGHCTTTAYMLKGGVPVYIELNKVPENENELIELLTLQSTTK